MLPLLQIPPLGVLCEERVSASTRKEESGAESSLLIRKLSWVSTPHHAQNLHSLFLMEIALIIVSFTEKTHSRVKNCSKDRKHCCALG